MRLDTIAVVMFFLLIVALVMYTSVSERKYNNLIDLMFIIGCVGVLALIIYSDRKKNKECEIELWCNRCSKKWIQDSRRPYSCPNCKGGFGIELVNK